jgi:uncharacterized membrane protein HdeD (DUF308 family)
MTFDVGTTVALARWWWTFVLRGALAIVFGVVAFLAPGLGLGILLGMFAAYAIIDGIGSLVAGVTRRGRDRTWWVEVLEGVAGVAAGAIAVVFPEFAAEALILIIAAWATVTGVLEIIAAVRLREQIRGEGWLGLAGVASILFGVVLFLFPAAGALSVVWLIGSFSFVFGAFLVLLGLRLRRIHEAARRDAATDHAR